MMTHFIKTSQEHFKSYYKLTLKIIPEAFYRTVRLQEKYLHGEPGPAWEENERLAVKRWKLNTVVHKIHVRCKALRMLSIFLV